MPAPVPSSAASRPVRAALRPLRGRAVLAAALLAGHQLGEAAVPVVVGAALDAAVATSDAARLGLWLAVLAADFALLSLCWRFGSRAAAGVRLGVEHRLRLAVVARLVDPAGLRGDSAAARTLTVAVSDARRVAAAVRSALAAFAALVAVVAVTVALLRLSPVLAALVLGAGVLVLVVVAVLSAPVEARSHGEQHANERAAAMAVDLVAGLRVLAGLHAGAAAAAAYRQVSGRARTAAVRAADAEAAVDGVTAAAAGASLLAVAAVCSVLAVRGEISLGDLIAVLGLSQLLLGPLRSLAGIVPALRRGRASARRVRELTAAAAALPDPASAGPARPAAGLEVRAPAVWGPAPLVAGPGEAVGVAFADPAAAERFCAGLAGEAEEAEGMQARWAGIRLAALPAAERRAAVLVWPHDALPLGATPDELLGPGGAGAAAAVSAAVALDDVLERLPAGGATALGERAALLSGGQRQRLALARVLREDPPVLVLHEPVSALDAATALHVARGLVAQRRGRTTLIVTTTPALLAQCDTVWFAAGDGAVGCGSHTELLADRRYRAAVSA